MKRKVTEKWFLLLLCVSLLLMTGCQSKESESTEGAGSTEEGEVTEALVLGQYMGLSADYPDASVTEELLEEAIAEELTTYASYVSVGDAAVLDGSVILADVEVWLDGVLVRILTDQIITVDTSSEDYISQLAGYEVGDVVTIGVQYGTGYKVESLRGKTLEYRVNIQTVLDVIAMDLEEYVEEYTEYLSSEEYKAAVSKTLAEELAKEALATWQSDIQNQVLEGCTVNVYDEDLVSFYQDLFLAYDASCMALTGLDSDSYILANYYCTSEKEYEAFVTEKARNAAGTTMILEEIAALENITVTDQDVEAFAEAQYEQYGFESASEFTAAVDDQVLAQAAQSAAVWNYIYENSTRQ